jgi:hypothetical protein
MADSTELDLQEQTTRIDRAIVETAKYVDEQRELGAKAENFDRNRWQIVVTAMAAGSALFSAGAAFVKLLISWGLVSDARIDRLEARLAHIEQAIIRIEERGGYPATSGDQGRTRRQPQPALQLEAQGGNDRRHSAALAAGATGAIILTYLTHH